MSGEAPSEYGGPIWRQKARAKVSEWLKFGAGNSDVTSGVDSMSVSASYMEKLDGNPLTDKIHHAMQCFYPEKDKTMNHTRVSTDSVKTQHRHSF